MKKPRFAIGYSLETNRLVTAVTAREAHVQPSRHGTKSIEIYEGTDP